ncbi:MAG: hypothetical protein ACTTIC_07065 [Helicobacteraceae bacterium]
MLARKDLWRAKDLRASADLSAKAQAQDPNLDLKSLASQKLFALLGYNAANVE